MDVVALVSSTAERQPIAVMRATEFRADRDLTFVGLLAAATVFLVTVGLPTGERIIPLTAVAAIAIGWARSLRESWSIGHDWISHRRWFGDRCADIDDLTAINLLSDADDRIDAIVLVGARARVTVPVHELRANPEFAAELGELVGLAAARSIRGAAAARSVIPG